VLWREEARGNSRGGRRSVRSGLTVQVSEISRPQWLYSVLFSIRWPLMMVMWGDQYWYADIDTIWSSTLYYSWLMVGVVCDGRVPCWNTLEIVDILFCYSIRSSTRWEGYGEYIFYIVTFLIVIRWPFFPFCSGRFIIHCKLWLHCGTWWLNYYSVTDRTNEAHWERWLLTLFCYSDAVTLCIDLCSLVFTWEMMTGVVFLLLLFIEEV